MARRGTTTVVALTVAALVAVACGRGDDGGGDGGNDSPDASGLPDAELIGSLSPDDAAEAGAAVTTFGLDLHRELVAAEDGNVVTSPLSASVLLAMVGAGAGGDNAAEFVDVLGLEDVRDTRYAALLADLLDAGDVDLSIANALWAADGIPFEDDYLDHARQVFGATLDEVDLGSQEAVDEIDAWVVEQTEGLIDGITEDLGLPDPQTVLVLANAVYFLGEWTTTFDEADTVDAPFTLADGTEVDVPTMHRTDDGEIEQAWREGMTVLRLPYGDDERFGMELFVPEDGDVEALLADLDGEAWAELVDELQPSPYGTLALPRFELEWDAELNDPLQALGLERAFGDGDFTPMSPADPFLSAVVQKTYIRVDEEGTEAAAVTGGAMRLSAPGDLRVDRPFLFTVSDRDTGTVLFLGTVTDPRG